MLTVKKIIEDGEYTYVLGSHYLSVQLNVSHTEPLVKHYPQYGSITEPEGMTAVEIGAKPFLAHAVWEGLYRSTLSALDEAIRQLDGVPYADQNVMLARRRLIDHRARMRQAGAVDKVNPKAIAIAVVHKSDGGRDEKQG